eukprot:scaffold190231_cov31-Tisochrysis_lutea.AAC.1
MSSPRRRKGPREEGKGLEAKAVRRRSLSGLRGAEGKERRAEEGKRNGVRGGTEKERAPSIDGEGERRRRGRGEGWTVRARGRWSRPSLSSLSCLFLLIEFSCSFLSPSLCVDPSSSLSSPPPRISFCCRCYSVEAILVGE